MASYPNSWLKIIHPEVVDRLGLIQHVLLDFDGTISVLRQGWEKVMVDLMLASICGESLPDSAIKDEVIDYIDQSTGILTIRQMEWLVEAVKRHGLVERPMSARQYKSRYLDMLMVYVRERIADVAEHRIAAENMMIMGAGIFISSLWNRGMTLYVASGSDHPDVVNEVRVLGLAQYFNGGIYGALDVSEANDKERIIQRILDENRLMGNQLLVIGDGPVEIRVANQRDALTLGIASDEVARQGWNQRKADRVVKAGCDFLISDFSHTEELITCLFP